MTNRKVVNKKYKFCLASSREFGEGLPLELLYADDLVLMAESKEL